MMDTLKTYVKTLPRHQRLLIFVDDSISETHLRGIMEANLNIWGRYNPIIPVHNNTIKQEWLDIIKFFDPDYIYYSKMTDLSCLAAIISLRCPSFCTSEFLLKKVQQGYNKLNK